MDLIGGLLLLGVALPLMLAVAVLIRLTMGSPVLFRQMRPGKDCRPFEILKFRTMTNATDRDGVLLDDERRLTPLGRRLRRLSFDELPELLNVLKGDMSLVGPRPLLPQYLDRYSPNQSRRHEVRPGITGLAQVAGRNELSWEERLALDVEYVDRRSLRLDVEILARTIVMVVSGRGVAARGHATMFEFEGPGDG